MVGDTGIEPVTPAVWICCQARSVTGIYRLSQEIWIT